MKLLSICPNRRASKTRVTADNRTKLTGLSCKGYISLKSRKTGAITEIKKKVVQVRIFATKTALKLSQGYQRIKDGVKRELQAKQAFILSIKLAAIEMRIKAKKQLLKYGYSFAKTVEVARAYLALRNFKQGLSYSLKSMIF